MSMDENGAIDEIAQRSSPPSKRPSVVAIDDSPIVRTVIEHILSRIGVRATTFPDGASAVRAMTSGATPIPDLLLLDIGLPHLTGYDIAEIMRAHAAFAATPIVMLSARDGILDKMRSKMVGASGFISKPFKANDFAATVCGYLGVSLEQASVLKGPRDE